MREEGMKIEGEKGRKGEGGRLLFNYLQSEIYRLKIVERKIPLLLFPLSPLLSLQFDASVGDGEHDAVFCAIKRDRMVC